VSSGRPLVLVVDDNSVNRTLVADILKAKGFRVAKADSAKAAVDLVVALRPALVLMDINMPGMSGLEAVRVLRSHPQPDVAATPVVTLSALARPSDRANSLAAGASDYLPRPSSIHEMLAAIERLLANRPQGPHGYVSLRKVN